MVCSAWLSKHVRPTSTLGRAECKASEPLEPKPLSFTLGEVELNECNNIGDLRLIAFNIAHIPLSCAHDYVEGDEKDATIMLSPLSLEKCSVHLSVFRDRSGPFSSPF